MAMEDTLGAYYRESQIFDHTSDIFTNGSKVEHSLTMSGGNESTTYYLNYSNMKHNGFFVGPNNYYNRQSIRLNFDQDVNKKLSIAAKMYYSTTDGSFNTTPSPFTYTSVFAVPRSIAISFENNPNILSIITVNTFYIPSIFNSDTSLDKDLDFLKINLFNELIYAFAEATIISGSEPFA